MFGFGKAGGVGSASASPGSPMLSIRAYLAGTAKAAEDLPPASQMSTQVVQVSEGSFDQGKTSEVPKDGVTTADDVAPAGETAVEEESAFKKNVVEPVKKGLATAADWTTKGTSAMNDGVQMASEALHEGVHAAADGAVGVAMTPLQAVQELSGWVGKHTGFNLIDPNVKIPTTLAELQAAGAQPFHPPKQLSPAEFKRQFCDHNPYPECPACKAANNIHGIDEFDLMLLFRGLEATLRALLNGNLFGNIMMDCPGQIAAVLGDKLGPLGTIVGKVAASALITATAAHGAMKAFNTTVRAFKNTDFLGELQHSVLRAIKSGGGGFSFTALLGGITHDLDMDVHEMMHNLHGGGIFSNKSKRVNNFGGALAASFGLGIGVSGSSTKNCAKCRAATKRSGGVNKSGKAVGGKASNSAGGGRGNNLPPEGGFSAFADAKIGAMSSAQLELGFADPSDPSSGRLMPTEEATAAVKTVSGDLEAVLSNADSLVDNPISAAAGLGENQINYVICNDELAKEGVKYFYLDDYDEEGNPIYKLLETEPGQPLDALRATYGNLFTIEGQDEETSAAQPAYDSETVYTEGWTYFYKDPDTGLMIAVECNSAEEFAALVEEHGELFVKNKAYTTTTDTVGDENKQYYKKVVVPVFEVAKGAEQYTYEGAKVGEDYIIGAAIDPAEEWFVLNPLTGEHEPAPGGMFVAGPTYTAVPGTSTFVALEEGYGYVGKKVADDTYETIEPPSSGTVEDYLTVHTEYNSVYVEENPQHYFSRTENVVGEDGVDYIIGAPVEAGKWYVLDPVTGEKVLTTDVTFQAGVVYYKVTDEEVSYVLIPSEEIAGKLIAALGFEVFELTVEGPEPKAVSLDTPIVLSTGLPLERPVDLPADAYFTAIDTSNLVTGTHVPAAIMAQLNGIGMTVDEIKMAYVLDHVQNGSVLPEDVEYEEIKTVLDNLPDE